MRMNDKASSAMNSANQLFNVNFDDFVSKENNVMSTELASEFGVSPQDVKKLKKHLGRS